MWRRTNVWLSEIHSEPTTGMWGKGCLVPPLTLPPACMFTDSVSLPFRSGWWRQWAWDGQGQGGRQEVHQKRRRHRLWCGSRLCCHCWWVPGCLLRTWLPRVSDLAWSLTRCVSQFLITVTSTWRKQLQRRKDGLGAWPQRVQKAATGFITPGSVARQTVTVEKLRPRNRVRDLVLAWQATSSFVPIGQKGFVPYWTVLITLRKGLYHSAAVQHISIFWKHSGDTPVLNCSPRHLSKQSE